MPNGREDNNRRYDRDDADFRDIYDNWPYQSPVYPGYNPPGRPGRPGMNQPPYSRYPGYPGFPGFPGRPGQYPNQPDFPERPDLPDRPGQDYPPGPPPRTTPSARQGQGQPELYRIDRGAIRNCRYHYVYLWLENGRSFWAWLTYIGRTSVAGYRWNGYRWVYFGTDLDNISDFVCY